MYNILYETELLDREIEIIEDDVDITIFIYMNQKDLNKLNLLDFLDYIDYENSVVCNYLKDDEFDKLVEQYFREYRNKETNGVMSGDNEHVLFRYFASKY